MSQVENAWSSNAFPTKINGYGMKREGTSICQVIDFFFDSFRCQTAVEHESLAIMMPKRYSRTELFS